jgi:tetratricopeptide (TPR) repeat protein
MILELLEVTAEPSEKSLLYFLGCAMAGWIEVEFLPSDFKASFDRINSRLSANDELSAIGEWQFWHGLYFKEMENWAEAKSSFDLALKDASLPQGIRLASLYLKAWCYVGLGEYDEADKVLTELRNAVSTFANKWYVDHLQGYIWALRDHGLTEVYSPVALALDIKGEIEGYEERGKAESLAEGVLLVESKIEDLKLTIERIEPRLLLGMWQAKEEIIKSVPITHTLEEVSKRLRDEHGDWVSKLANQGALTSAEFLYEALSRRSWSEAVMGYANAIEAEIRSRLLQPLETFVRERTGTTLLTIGQKFVKVEGDKLNLFDCEEILRGAESSSLLKDFFSLLPSEACSFLLHQLPDDLSRLRKLRNPSAHGAIVVNAKEMRKLVLGTPEKPGLLKRLTEINIPYTR